MLFCKEIAVPIDNKKNWTVFNSFQDNVLFLTPENIGKPEVFLTFSGDIEMEHWCEMTQKPLGLLFDMFVMLGTEKVPQDDASFTTFTFWSNWSCISAPTNIKLFGI